MGRVVGRVESSDFLAFDQRLQLSAWLGRVELIDLGSDGIVSGLCPGLLICGVLLFDRSGTLPPFAAQCRRGAVAEALGVTSARVRQVLKGLVAAGANLGRWHDHHFA
jgi:hypothetical protein